MKLTGPEDILALYQSWGQEQYAEAVTQLTHAVQCAERALQEAASTPLALATLLHDVGHLIDLAQRGLRADTFTIDHRHEWVGAEALGGLYPPMVIEPIRLHVAAKRWWCATDPGYLFSLSPASQESLALQGGPMTPAEAEAFITLPYAQEAVRLRRWDDGGKNDARHPETWARFASLFTQLQP